MDRERVLHVARRLGASVGTAIIMVIAVTAPAHAAAPTECQYDESTRTLTIGTTLYAVETTGEGAGVTLAPQSPINGERPPYPEILVFDNPQMKGEPVCSGPPVDQVDRIKFFWPDDEGNQYDWSNRQVGIDLSRGPFAPGFTNEPGTSDEIEFEFHAGGPDTFGHQVFIFGGNAADNLAVGANGINLNASESGGADADLTLSGAPLSGVTVLAFGELGNDRISFAGGSGTGGSYPSVNTNTYPCFAKLCAYGGDGNDTLVASTGAEILAGERGRDTVDYSKSESGVTVDLEFEGPNPWDFPDTGGSDMDRLIGIENLIGTPFRDVFKGNASANDLRGGSGNDRLVGRDGNDRLNGGAGNDDCLGGAGSNVLLLCE